MNTELQQQTDTLVRSIELLRNDLGRVSMTLYVICGIVFAIFLIVAIRRRGA